MDLPPVNTIESQIILLEDEKLQEINLLIPQVLDWLGANRLDQARMRTVVTRYKMSRNIFGRKYPVVHTMDYATWQMDIGTIVVLCSDGRIYVNREQPNFWGRKVQHYMPVVYIDPSFRNTMLRSLQRMMK